MIMMMMPVHNFLGEKTLLSILVLAEMSKTSGHTVNFFSHSESSKVFPWLTIVDSESFFIGISSKYCRTLPALDNSQNSLYLLIRVVAT